MTGKKIRTIKRDTVAILISSLVGLLALLLVVFSTQMRRLIQETEVQGLLHQAHISEVSLLSQVKDMPDTCEKWAERKSIQRYLLGILDLPALEQELLAQSPFMKDQLNLFALLDTEGSVRFYQAFDYINYQYRETQTGLESIFTQISAEPSQGFVYYNGQVYYLCAAPVRQGSAALGTLVIGRLIDDTVLSKLPQRSSAIDFTPLIDLKITDTQFQSLNQEEGIIIFRGFSLTAYYSMSNLFDDQPLVISLTSYAPFFRTLRLVAVLTGLVVAAGAIIIFFITRHNEKVLTRPLAQLGETLAGIELETYSGLAPTGTMTDLILLTDSINSMLQRAVTDRQMIVETRDLMFNMANYDSLTYLLNRFSSQTTLNERIESARETGLSITILFLDIVHFKNINDSLGHDVGDSLFTMLAERMRDSFPPDTLLARMGGDEFMVAGVEEEGQTSFREIIHTIFNTPFVVKERHIDLEASLGCSHFPEDGDDAETLIKNAELAMYRASELDDDRFVVYQPQFQAALKKRLETENRMRRIISEGCHEFVVFLQPKATIQTGEIVQCEALMRWITKAGMIPPNDFIPQAEDSGLIVPLTWWLIRECCRIGRMFQDLRKPHTISINVPAQVLLHKDFLNILADAVHQTGVDINLLDIEITESTLLNDMERVNDVLKELHKMGTEVSIDDFGTGYSSLSYLSKLAVDRIKIDRAFVMGVDQDEESRDIVRAIMALAKSLKLSVTAEGVETWEQFSFLREIDCDEAQGYYVSRPLSFKDYYTFVCDWDKDKLISGTL